MEDPETKTVGAGKTHETGAFLTIQVNTGVFWYGLLARATRNWCKINLLLVTSQSNEINLFNLLAALMPRWRELITRSMAGIVRIIFG
jgi:hypothetical protein